MNVALAVLADLRRDLLYAGRSLAKNRAFAAAAVLTLAVGIGATTAICTVVDAVLLRPLPLPLPDGDRLVRIVENDRPRNMASINYQEYLEWRARTATLSGLAAVTFDPRVMMRTPAGLVRLTVGFVSADYFEVLGARAILGRTLIPADAGGADVVVLGFYTWQRLFGADPAVIGTRVEFRTDSSSRSAVIAGVLPESMETIGSPMDLYAPIVNPPGRPAGVSSLVGRLRHGVSVAAASQEAGSLGSAIRPPRPASAPTVTRPRFEARSLTDGVVADLRPALRIFLAAVAVVLAIVCANVAGLILARGLPSRSRPRLSTRAAGRVSARPKGPDH